MYEEFKKNFLEFYQNNKDKKFVISAHRHPDSDAIASAYALNSIFPNSIIGLQDHLSEDTKPLMEKLGIKYKLLKELKKSSYDGLIVTDCHSYTLLKDAEGWNVVLLIDHHHEEGKLIHAPLEFIDSDSPSSSEIVYTLIPKVSKKVAFALAAAIISDTARFKSAKFSSFEILSKLIKLSGSDYLEIFKHAYPQIGRAHV